MAIDATRGLSGEDHGGLDDMLCAVDSSFVDVTMVDTYPKPDVCVFSPPVSEDGRVVNITASCVNGTCCCENVIGGTSCDLKPCRVGHFLFGGECCLPSKDVMEIWNGLCDGFRIVDDDCVSTYECKNYLSITESKFKDEMSNLLVK